MLPRVILCAGLNRSGSTWQYNIIRLLISSTYGTSYGAWIANYDATNIAPVHVVKIHDPHDLGVLKPSEIVSSYRDLRGVLASARRMEWSRLRTRKEIQRFLDGYITREKVWQTRAVHMMRYEEMVRDPGAEALKIAKKLRLDVTNDDLERAYQAVVHMKAPKPEPTGNFSDVDPLTQLHPGHISGRILQLDQMSRTFVEERYHSWLKSHGYRGSCR